MNNGHPAETVGQLKTILTDFHDDTKPIAVHIWYVEDILALYPDLSYGEAITVLYKLHNHELDVDGLIRENAEEVTS